MKHNKQKAPSSFHSVAQQLTYFKPATGQYRGSQHKQAHAMQHIFAKMPFVKMSALPHLDLPVLPPQKDIKLTHFKPSLQSYLPARK